MKRLLIQERPNNESKPFAFRQRNGADSIIIVRFGQPALLPASAYESNDTAAHVFLFVRDLRGYLAETGTLSSASLISLGSLFWVSRTIHSGISL